MRELVETLRNELRATRDDLNKQTFGFTSEHEVGYHEGRLAQVESMLERMEELFG